jgi:hypothetical protein
VLQEKSHTSKDMGRKMELLKVQGEDERRRRRRRRRSMGG